MTSNKQQEENGKLVENHVLCCQSSLVDGLLAQPQTRGEWGNPSLESNIVDYDDIRNLYVDPSKYKDYGYKSEDAFRDSGEDAQEIFEWWVVSDWLAKKLEERGEPILEYGQTTWWGRCTTGQAILLDGVITDIQRS